MLFLCFFCGFCLLFLCLSVLPPPPPSFKTLHKKNSALPVLFARRPSVSCTLYLFYHGCNVLLSSVSVPRNTDA